MKRLVKYLIALALVFGFSMYCSSTRVTERSVRAQAGMITLDPSNLGMNITHLIEELIRAGDVIGDVTSGVANAAQVAQIRSMVESLTNIFNTLQTINAGIETISILWNLVSTFIDDIQFMRDMDRLLTEMESEKELNFFDSTMRSLNLVTSYIAMGNMIISNAWNEYQYIMKEVKKHSAGFNQNSPTASSWSAKDVLSMTKQILYDTYSTYYAFRGLYLNRYHSIYRRYTRNVVTIGNEKSVAIVF